jgi:ribonuclease HI
MTRTTATSRLFPDAPAGPPAGVHVANIDGASRGNPGPASYALILRDPHAKVVFQLSKKLGRQTNNVAEYYALLAALDYAVNHGIAGLRIRSDSQLLVRQMRGRYRVKSPDLKPLYERASKLAKQLDYFVVEHVPREMNREADALANRALDDHPPGSSDSCPQDSDLGKLVSAPPPRTIRTRVVNGALVPLEPLGLREGSEVVVTLRKL